MVINEDMFDKFASLFNHFVHPSYSRCGLIILWLASFVRTACWSHDDLFEEDTLYPCGLLLPDELLIFVLIVRFSSCGRFKRGGAQAVSRMEVAMSFHGYLLICLFGLVCFFLIFLLHSLT